MRQRLADPASIADTRGLRIRWGFIGALSVLGGVALLVFSFLVPMKLVLLGAAGGLLFGARAIAFALLWTPEREVRNELARPESLGRLAKVSPRASAG